MDSAKLNKERIISCLEEMIVIDGQLVKPKFNVIVKRGKNECLNASATEITVIRQFVSFCRLIRLVDAQFSIERTQKNQLAIIFVAKKIEDFFWKHIARFNRAFLKKWDTVLVQESIALSDAMLQISRHMIFGEKLYLFERRREMEHTIHLQKAFRQELLKSEEFTMELDLESQQEILKANLMEVDDACLIIQCAERMYQAIARYVYLTEVRKKAMDLHADKKEFDQERAVILIQARTRGLLTRKKVRRMREDEQQVLGLSVESLLISNMTDRRARRQMETPQIKHVLGTADQQLELGSSQFRMPPTLGEYLEAVRSDLFMVDPLRLVDRATESTGSTKLHRRSDNSTIIVSSNYKKYNQETENLLCRLNLFGICKLEISVSGPNMASNFDDLISLPAEVCVNRKQPFVFDLRNFLYVTTVIPHVISGWPIKRQKRHTILFIGEDGAGKSAWARAIANKCGAACVIVNRRTFLRKNRARIFNCIQQTSSVGSGGINHEAVLLQTSFLLDIKAFEFVNHDQYAVVLFDQLELFLTDHKEKKTAVKQMTRDLLRTLIREENCQVIGMTRRDELEPSILDFFNLTVRIQPPMMINRFELIADTLSRRFEAENLQRMPKRLLDLSKTTTKLNCGNTIKKADKKFAKKFD